TTVGQPDVAGVVHLEAAGGRVDLVGLAAYDGIPFSSPPSGNNTDYRVFLFDAARGDPPTQYVQLDHPLTMPFWGLGGSGFQGSLDGFSDSEWGAHTVWFSSPHPMTLTLQELQS
ncbi:MAG TPA: hypothetical protein VGB18_01260, partial [Candidatus Thermoplasmatota archaeon]